MKNPKFLYELWRLGQYDYSECYGFVIRAHSARQARRIAADNCGLEGREVWLSGKTAALVRLEPTGKIGIVLGSFHAG